MYIDEAGDEGFKISPTFVGQQGSSRWFVVTAVVVPAQSDRQTAAAVNRIKTKLWPNLIPHKKVLHWRDLKHSQKRVALGELKSEQFRWLSVAMEKDQLKRDRFDSRIVRKDKPWIKAPLYNYATRLLFERLGKIAQSENQVLDVVFENRASLSIPDVTGYLNLLVTLPGPYGAPTIPPGRIGSVTAQAKGTSKMLQIADVCAGALNNALEPNMYGQIEESYLLTLATKIHRPQGHLWGYGLKLFPKEAPDCMARWPAYAWMKDL